MCGYFLATKEFIADWARLGRLGLYAIRSHYATQDEPLCRGLGVLGDD